jgi:hypothetical protein
MKRLILVMTCGLAFMGIHFLGTCSRPLESLGDSDSVPQETMFVVDTVTRVDTVIIIEPDTSGSVRFCARLASCRKDIVWMFQNQAGLYRLEFVAVVDQEHPPHALEVNIDGQQHLWYPVETTEFIMEQDLGEDATARISSGSPHSFGHAIDICLIVKVL